MVGLLIAAGEVLNGNLRVRYLQRRFDRKPGRVAAFATGVVMFSLIAWLLLPWVGPDDIGDCLLVGLVWTILLTLLDLYFGRYVFRMPWRKILDDFNPLKGNLLGVGLCLLFICPSLVFLLR